MEWNTSKSVSLRLRGTGLIGPNFDISGCRSKLSCE